MNIIGTRSECHGPVVMPGPECDPCCQNCGRMATYPFYGPLIQMWP